MNVRQIMISCFKSTHTCLRSWVKVCVVRKLKLLEFTIYAPEEAPLRDFASEPEPPCGTKEPATVLSSSFPPSAPLSSVIGTILSFPIAIKFRFRVTLLFLRPPPAVPAAAAAAAVPFFTPEVPPPLPVVAVSEPRRPSVVVMVPDALRSAGFELRSPYIHSWCRFYSMFVLGLISGSQGYEGCKREQKTLHCVVGDGERLRDDAKGKGGAVCNVGRNGAVKYRPIESKPEVKRRGNRSGCKN